MERTYTGFSEDVSLDLSLKNPLAGTSIVMVKLREINCPNNLLFMFVLRELLCTFAEKILANPALDEKAFSMSEYEKYSVH